VSQGCPTGNGEIRGPESAQGPGTPLPGSRPSRAAANNARNADFLGQTPVADQGGFGTEDMIRPASYIGASVVEPSDIHSPPPDLMSMGDPGETFGGM
jgi:hypothetical protein